MTQVRRTPAILCLLKKLRTKKQNLLHQIGRHSDEVSVSDNGERVDEKDEIIPVGYYSNLAAEIGFPSGRPWIWRRIWALIDRCMSSATSA